MVFTVNRFGANLSIPDLKIVNATVNQYELAPNVKYEEGGLEYELVLKRNPRRNSWTLPFSYSNLRFDYQPPLTELFREEDCVEWTPTYVKTKRGRESRRPEDVVGSYAVYHAICRGNEFKTGKLFHIYRPKLFDVNGLTEYGSLSISGNELTITVPNEYLKTAVYPVKIDPTFGYTSIGGSTDNWGDYGTILCRFQAPENGTTSSIKAYFSRTSGSGNAANAIYEDDGGMSDNKLAQSSTYTATSTPQWWSANVVQAITASTYYWLGYYSAADFYTYYDSGVSNQAGFDYVNLPDPMDFFEYQMAWNVSVYAEYTASGGGVPISAISNHYHIHINKKIKGG